MPRIELTPDTSNRLSRGLASFAVAILMGAGLYLRSLDLAAPSFNEDELFHVHAAMSLNSDGVPTLPGGHEYRRALPFTRLLAVIFQRSGGPGEFAARMPSVAFGVLLIWLTYLAGAAIADRATGILAAAFLAVSPYAILLSRFARMYTVHECLYVIAFLLFFWTFEDDALPAARRRWLFFLGSAVFLFAVYNHEITAFFAVGLFGYCLWRVLQTAYVDGWRPAFWSRYGLAAMVMTIAGLAALALPAVREKAMASWRWIPEWAQSNVGNLFYYRWFLRNEYGLLAYMAVPGALWLAARRPREGAYLVSQVALPLVILTFWPLKHTRYFSHLFPLYLVLVAAGFRAVVGGTLRVVLEAWRNRGGPVTPDAARAISAPVFVIAGLAALFFTPGVATPTEVREGALGDSGAVNFLPWRDAADFLRKNATESDVVIASRPPAVRYYFGPVDYSLDRQGEVEIQKWGWMADDEHMLDNAGGAPYLEDTEQFEEALSGTAPVWLALQKSLFRADRDRLSRREKSIIASEFRQEYATADGSILVFHRPAVQRR